MVNRKTFFSPSKFSIISRVPVPELWAKPWNPLKREGMKGQYDRMLCWFMQPSQDTTGEETQGGRVARLAKASWPGCPEIIRTMTDSLLE